jgi:HAD superfamily hydrolase (TIGR01490 family)
MASPSASERPDVLTGYRHAGEASAARAAEHVPAPAPAPLPGATPDSGAGAGFFDVDNTIMRGASIFHLAVGLARRNYFTMSEISGFAIKQLKFVTSGSEDLEDMASVTESALSFIEGRSVAELESLGEEIFDDVMVDKLIPGTLALAQAHLDAGQPVWLVTATPVEIASLIARRLGLTGALGTVSEIVDGHYTGRLDGPPLHGLAKAEAVRALARTQGIDLSASSAYSDSINDIPMLSCVGTPFAVNPDPELRAYAKANDWRIRDFRRRAHMRRYALPAAAAAGGLALGMAGGLAAARIRGR